MQIMYVLCAGEVYIVGCDIFNQLSFQDKDLNI